MNILFTVVCLNCAPLDQLRLLIESTRKKFLKTHNVKIVIVTNTDVSYPGVDVVNITVDSINNENYFQLYKILALNHIDLNNYDYVFVSDIDQMFINAVEDNDLLLGKLCIMQHFYPELRTADNMQFWSDVIQITDRNSRHTMGNFFGGPVTIIKDVLSYVNDYWQKYKDHKFHLAGFFCKYPEEVLLVKYISDKQIEEYRIPCSIHFTTPAFMTNINAFGNLFDHLNDFKLIHNIKIDMEGAEKLYKIRCEP